MIQLRDKALGDDGLVTAAREFRAAADAGGALFVLNDRPDLVAAVRRRRRPRRPGGRLAGGGARGGRARRDRRALDARARAVRRRRGGPRRRLPRRRPGARDADQAGPPRRGPRTTSSTRPRTRASRGSRSAASTRATSARSSRAAPRAWSSCARSPTRERPRGRGARAARGAGGPAMGKRSRKARTGRRRRRGWRAATPARRERDEAARAQLEPLAPGERPLAVTIAALLSFAVAIANLVLYLAGWEVRGQDPELGGALVVCAVFALAGVGMWRMQLLGGDRLRGAARRADRLGRAVADARVQSQRGAAVARGDRRAPGRCSGS